MFSNLINAGSYLLEEEVFDVMPTGRHSLERDVFPLLAERGQLNGVPFQGYFIDAGTPTSWSDGVEACIEHGRFSRGHVVDGSWCTEPRAPMGVRHHASMFGRNVTAKGATVERSTRCSTASASAKAPASTTSWPAKAPSSEKGASCVMWCLDPVPWSRTANASPANDGLPRDGEAAKPRDRLVHS